MKEYSNIIGKNFIYVDILSGVRKIQYAFRDNGIEYFLVNEDGKLIGIVTSKELIGANPNRIAADVMSHKYKCINPFMYIWEVKEVFDLYTDIDVLLIQNQGKIDGYITRNMLNMELGKHIDLLTGLFKSDYMYYNAYNLINNGKHTSIIFIDLDNFGLIDKMYGHINGDAILKNVANLLSEIVDSHSHLCRYAGDEFAIVTSKSIEDSKILAEKIINSIELYHFDNDIQVSASIGITGLGIQNRQIENIQELIDELVNTASLSSTKAKQELNKSIIIKKFNLDAIA